jgi:hypothetical protein
LIHAIRPGARVPVEALTREPRRLVPHADGLQRNRRQDSPAGRRANLLCEPLRVFEIAAQAPPKTLRALLADQEPQLQRAEASAQRNAPVAKVLHLGVGG